MLFFIIVNIICLNVIFGIIIDTFADLRDKRNEHFKTLNDYCFICGIKRTHLDLYGNGFLRHYTIDHNVYSYLSFIIYIRNMEFSDCNGIEQFVKKQIDINNTKFMPLNAMCLKDHQLTQDDNKQD